MQENNEQTKNVSSDSSKTKKSSKKETKKTGGFFSEHKTEFKKITWPSRKILAKQTFTVIVICLIVGIIIFGYDLGIDFIIQNIIKLMA
ncbi:preprotein translocase subunit SecE [uncultured Tyzzerella sp.]|uniref:preprotein translocase subunit SecE n=1 Tax=uncultured Tyzzerella sp. TaxID=2321398 RepID=UPI002941CAA9|nr:preprotein translocase subunit SecE [uncultured Tyzzerella sp.]